MSVKIDLKILLFSAIFYVTNQLYVYGLLILFAILHEIMHVVVGFVVGVKPVIISVTPFGCSASFIYRQKDCSRKAKCGNMAEIKKLIIYIAGPIFNLVVSFISIGLFSNEIVGFVNIVIFLFNCVPIYPLDGGRIVKSLLHIWKGKEFAYRYVMKISNVMIIILLIACSFLVLKYNNIGIILSLVYLIMIWKNSNMILKNKLRLIELIKSRDIVHN